MGRPSAERSTRSARPARSANGSETDQDRFYTDNEEQGFVTQTDDNVVTAAEDVDGEDELDSEDDLARDEEQEARSARSVPRAAPAIRNQMAQEQGDDEDGDDDDDDRVARTPRNRSKSNLAATPRGTPRTRPRSYSRSNKLAPEEEGWALKDEDKRRKGGVFGRIKRLGRKPKDSAPEPGLSREGANADVVLGRSYGAVRELRSRKSSVHRPESVASDRTRDRAMFRRGAAASALSSGIPTKTSRSVLGSSRSASGRGGFDDDFNSELGSARQSSRLRARRPPSVIASDDETELGRGPEGVSKNAPRLPLPVALRDAENARSPQIVDPSSRSKSLAGSRQPSMLDVSDASPILSPSSPLIPLSGPLSHKEAVVPSQRPSMQSMRDNEIDDETMSRSRKPSMDLRAAAGGALGGLAAMIGLDALRESKDGLPPKDAPLASALGLTSDQPTAQDPDASTSTVNAATPKVETAASTTRASLLPIRNRRKSGSAAGLGGSSSEDTSPAAGAAPLEAPSELPYVVGDDAVKPGQDNEKTRLAIAEGSRMEMTEVAAAPVAVGAAVQARDYAAPPITEGSDILADDEAAASSVSPIGEKSRYSMLGLAATRGGRKSKNTTGSRGFEKLPPVNEDGKGTRRAIPAPEKGNYLLTPSMAPSVADALDAGSNQVASSEGDWLTKNLSPQQTHYFLRELSTRELRWELDRAWLLTSFEKPQRQTPRARKDLSDGDTDSRINNFDESSDEGLLAMDEDEDEEAVFRRLPQPLGALYEQLPIPDLPLLRFLFKNAFCTFPLFVAPEDKVDQYVGGPPDKATLARTYFMTGVLPLLRAIQSRSLSAWVDRHGEGDGTPFSAVSTVGSLRNLLTKWAGRYVTAILRVGPGDPYFESERAIGKESWPWPASNLLPPEAYYAFRKPLDRLKYGGYEVDIVGIRRHGASARDYLIRLRRPNAPDQYVVRNDFDFEEFRYNLAKELNPYAFVKPLPPTRGRPDEDSEIEEESPLGSELANGDGAQDGLPRSSSERNRLPRVSNDGRRRYSVGVDDERPVLGREAPSERDSEALESNLDEHDNQSEATLQPQRGSLRAGGRERASEKTPKTRKFLSMGSLRRFGGGKETPPRKRSASLRRSDSNGTRFAPESPAKASPRGPLPPSDVQPRSSLRQPTPAGALDFDARRQKLRTWLRDALSIREASHAFETQDFLTIGGFYERELRRSDLDDIQERRWEDRHRRQEHERDAAEAGDDVRELRDVRDDIWFDCVEGDGFLKMYDALRETPDYARLPINYQKMVSWGNLQIARWLYGIFVAGDDSRANLARVQDVYESIPWKTLSYAMRSPAPQMVRAWRDQFLKRSFLQTVLQVILEDEPETIEEDLIELRRSIGSEVMFQKLRVYVDSPGDLKRLVRQHAEKAGVSLVAAIVRGSEQPKLNKAEVQRVMDATEAYQDFMKTLPSPTKKNNHREPGYRLIVDLQRTLRLLSLQRDGAQVRGMLQDPVIADALSTTLEPLMEELRRLHKIKGMGNAIMDLSNFLGMLLDHLTGLRARVVDPLHAINGIAEILDDAAPSWYPWLRKASDATPTVFSFFAWFRHLAMTVGAGSDDLAKVWTNPPAAPVAEDDEEGGDRQSVHPDTLPAHEGALDPATMKEINSLAEFGRRKRNRQMEIACRWAAGDTEEHHPIQVQGDGRGRTRTDPYMPREPRPARKAPGLDRFRKSFREAVSSVLSS